jgi:hypothetical protein
VAGFDWLQGIFSRRLTIVVAHRFGAILGWGPHHLKRLSCCYFKCRSEQKESFVLNVGRWEGSIWKWDLKWRHNLFVWEEKIILITQLMLLSIWIHFPTSGSFECRETINFRPTLDMLCTFQSDGFFMSTSSRPTTNKG